MADFKSFIQHNDTFVGNPNAVEHSFLPPGSYKLGYNRQTEQVLFQRFEPNYDQIIDLPSPEYDLIMREANIFLQPETKLAFKDYGFLYKRSFLLWGTHGTGKTMLVNRVCQKVVQGGGVILFNPNPQLLDLAFKILEDIQPNLTTLVIFEEFEQQLERHEDDLLSLLDGEVQKNNVMYMATTNHFEKIPARLKRPGRFATILEVKYPNAEARTVFLQKKLKHSDAGEIPGWVTATDGLSIDELKETVLNVKCLRQTLPDVVKRIKATKRIAIEAATGTGQFSEGADPFVDCKVDFEMPRQPDPAERMSLNLHKALAAGYGLNKNDESKKS